ncbi:hypothetical protein AcV5_009174 [Taiwanofungus camphoratus]|nr:hypothetical protein AcV5_009174 [Antrodia cinnamomea]KAI0940684.1 hypothetical protein AcV7_002997 [Antrodia cinnamomea]
MGRKHSNISGLSRFVQEAFNSEATLSAPAASLESPVVETSVTIMHATSGNYVAGTTRRASELPDGTTQSEIRPSKKRKVGLLGPGQEKYDATGLVPFYTQASQVPTHLQKYFSQRERYFSLYSSGCLLDEEGWYSVTPERVAEQIAERCRCDVVLDAFCGVGGNAIAFARTCERVIALDTSPVRLALARHNAALYGVADRIEFVLADFISFARALIDVQNARNTRKGTQPQDDKPAATPADVQTPRRKFDVVFLSPPWGGPSYLTDSPSEGRDVTEPNSDADPEERAAPEYSLSSIRPIHGVQLFRLARQLTKNVAYYLPRNVRLEEVAELVDNEGEQNLPKGAAGTKAKGREKVERRSGKETGKMREVEMVELEEEWMGSKLKALTCYFGGLVAGQEDQFYS